MIDWQKHPLLPVVVQDDSTNEVLMLAYMNREALELTLQTGYAHYYSRSRQRLWKKGETSGHVQKVVKALIDCDQDTLLLRVEQHGPACHTGRKSCFFTDLGTGEITSEPIKSADEIYGIVDALYHIILERKNADPKSSYTASLLHKGENAILKKVVEETGELCFAIKDGNEEQIIYEAADLLFHALVALGYKSISPDRIRQELSRRFGTSGITEKESRQK